MRFKVFLITCLIILPLLLVPCSHAKSPKPGPNFIWVKPHTSPNGNSVPGHWKHTGSPKKGKVWVPGHRAPDGKLLPGHWKALSPPQKRVKMGTWSPWAKRTMDTWSLVGIGQLKFVHLYPSS